MREVAVGGRLRLLLHDGELAVRVEAAGPWEPEAR
jgi:hypothetical protein